ncbi:MAG: hypothetical protein N3G22_04380 [Candidatus Micrarchaeota archaeon]|nr:hypothetical protein [Candidatus Micrarchaeota archaeon]
MNSNGRSSIIPYRMKEVPTGERLPELPKEVAKGFPAVAQRYFYFKREHERLAEILKKTPAENQNVKPLSLKLYLAESNAMQICSEAAFVAQFLKNIHSEEKINAVFKEVDKIRKEKPGKESMAEGSIAYLLEFSDNLLVKSAFAQMFLVGRGDPYLLEAIGVAERFFVRAGVLSFAPEGSFEIGKKEKKDSGRQVGSFWELAMYIKDHQE